MKRIAAVLLCLMFFGCAPAIKHIPQEIKMVGFDLEKYADKGFLITTGDYYQESKPIGIISMEYYPEANWVKVPAESKDQPSRYKWVYGSMDPDKAIEALYLKALENGANAITYFKIEMTTKIEPVSKKGQGAMTTVVPGYRVTGTLIKK